MARGALRLVQQVLGRRHQRVGTLGQRQNQQAARTHVEAGGWWLDLLGQQHRGFRRCRNAPAGCREQRMSVQPQWRGEVPGRRPGVAGGILRPGHHPPPSTDAEALSGMTFELAGGGSVDRRSADGYPFAPQGRCCRQVHRRPPLPKAQPAGMWNHVAAVDFQARRLRPRRPAHGGRPPRRGCPAPRETCPSPSPWTETTVVPEVVSTLISRHRQGQRQAEAVDFRTEVGTGGRHRGMAGQSGGQ